MNYCFALLFFFFLAFVITNLCTVVDIFGVITSCGVSKSVLF